MALEFKLPDLGEGVHEGEIVRWLVAEGDAVKPEQELVEVMTDKVTATLPSPRAGTVTRLHGSPGDVVRVGDVLVTLETEGADEAIEPAGAEAAAEPAGAAPHARPVSVSAPAGPETARAADGGARPLAMPAVRRLARELKVDLAALTGSGPSGVIVEADVRSAAPAAEGAAPPAAPSPAEPGEVRRVPLRGVRRAIAEHLVASHRETAPYTFVEECDFTQLVQLRERVQSLTRNSGVRLTYLPFIVAALGMALREHPHVNATFDEENGDLLLHPDPHIGVAVHTEQGLLVPVVRHVERRNLLDIAAEIERLSQAARAGSLTRADVQGGTFSVSSLGAVGGLWGTPMLNTPQVAVLGVHKIVPRAVVRDGQIVARQMGNLSLTLDHRYIDGYAGARFMETVTRYLEDPALMMFSLAELRGEGPGV